MFAGFVSLCWWFEWYSKNPHKRTDVLGVQADFFSCIGCFLQDQPENVLQVFLKSFL